MSGHFDILGLVFGPRAQPGMAAVGGGGSIDRRVFDLTPIEIVYRTEDERQSILPLLAAILSDEL